MGTVPERAADVSLSGDGITCDIYDLGSHRLVHASGPHYGTAGIVHDSIVETCSSIKWLTRLFDLKGRWVVNEVVRAQVTASAFDYYELRYGVRFDGASILELGCGLGATTIQALDRHAACLVGLDLEEQTLAMTEQRLAEHGHARRARLARIGQDCRLPVRDRGFDIAMALEVFEHVVPEVRGPLLLCLYEKVKPGGLLLISTPNRVVPKDLHTSGLWFTNYLPRPLATRYARLLSPRCRGKDDRTLISNGLLSFSWWEARRLLRHTDAIDLSNERSPLPGEVPSSSRAGLLWNRAAYLLWRTGKWIWGNWPFDAFASHLFLAFRRPEATS